MMKPTMGFTQQSAEDGAREARRQRELVEAAGGWFAYFKGQRRQREQAEAEARAEGQDKRPRGNNQHREG